MTKYNRATTVGVLALSLFTFAPSAFAYLDPSTGSMILSAIVGLLATAGLAVKTYWYKLKSFFRREPVPEPVETDKQPPETEPSAER
jgi:hypothetical protein